MPNVIRNCKFAFKCPKEWDELKGAGFPDVRYCPNCYQNVFLCATDDAIADAIRNNYCIAVWITEDMNDRINGPTLGVPVGY